jgi:uncharacterized damage-inducible protein DinB
MTPETAKALAEYITANLDYEFATTRKVLEAVPADTCGYKPSEKCMSGLELASHIATAEAFFLNGVLSGSFTPSKPELKTPADVVSYYDQTIPSLIARVREMPGEKLAQPLTFAIFTLPAVDYLTLSMKHGVHHRGQLSSYLRPMGAKVPSIYGPSADVSIPAADAASH